MNQKRISRLLIGAGGIAVLGILVLFGVYAPVLAVEMRTMYPDYAALYWPGLIGVECCGALFLLALAEYFRVCFRIGQGHSFCLENVRSLNRIAAYLGVFGCMWLCFIFAPGLFFGLDIGPVWVVFLLCAMAGFALSMLAWGLGRLLRHAVEIQEENELTV